MRKIAFFVEGLTEQLFLIKLIQEVYDKKTIHIVSTKGSGGNKHSISFTQLDATSITKDTRYSVLIVDCSGDGNIKSYILDQRQSLIKGNYSAIIGLRDVFPINRNDIHTLRYGLKYQVPQIDIEIKFILSIMEIEAWFLSEHTHFTRIDENLSPDAINNRLAFHPVNDDMELRDNPANDLNNAYSIVGQNYVKQKTVLERTINSLDYAILYFEPRASSFIELKSELDAFFSVT